MVNYLTYLLWWKMILWRLSSKSYRSMAKMRVIAPEMQRMKRRIR